MPHFRGPFAAAVLLCVGPFVAVDGVVAQEVVAARPVLESADCQLSLPEPPAATATDREPEPAPSPRRRDASRDPGPAREAAPQFRVPVVSLPLAEVLLWFGVAVAVVVLAIAMARSRGGTPAAAPVAATVRGRRQPAATPAPLPDHAQLAAAGDFAGALRALLGHALQRWSLRAGALPQQATARAVLRAVRLSPLPAEPLARLVAVVEQTQFAGPPPERDAYQRGTADLAAWEAACQPKP